MLPVGDIRMHIAVQGEGPLAVLCHGFPGLWFSWRHQLSAIADCGWRAVAVDHRGYGRTDRPTDIRSYAADQAIADMLHLLDALGEGQAVFIGHDFGAQLVWNLAVRAPEHVLGVAALSCPYDFDLAGRSGAGRKPGAEYPPDDPLAFASPHIPPSAAFAALAKKHFFHMHYFQKQGPPERELGSSPALFLKKLFWALSAEGNLLDWSRYPSEGTGYLDVLAEPERDLPWEWLGSQEFDYFLAEYTRTGAGSAFIGGLNSYRVADLNWELGRPWADADVKKPALFIAGREDAVLKMIRPDALEIMRRRVPGLRGILLIPGAGHFVQQEKPVAVNRALGKFLEELQRSQSLEQTVTDLQPPAHILCLVCVAQADRQKPSAVRQNADKNRINKGVFLTLSAHMSIVSDYGGEGGIRTPGPLARSAIFETAPFDHSGTSPSGIAILYFQPQPPGSGLVRLHHIAQILAKTIFVQALSRLGIPQPAAVRCEFIA